MSRCIWSGRQSNPACQCSRSRLLLKECSRRAWAMMTGKVDTRASSVRFPHSRSSGSSHSTASYSVILELTQDGEGGDNKLVVGIRHTDHSQVRCEDPPAPSVISLDMISRRMSADTQMESFGRSQAVHLPAILISSLFLLSISITPPHFTI